MWLIWDVELANSHVVLPMHYRIATFSASTYRRRCLKKQSLTSVTDFVLNWEIRPRSTGSWDLIFSNAALHWSENHNELIPRLFQNLKPGGQLAAQVPTNHNHISHQVYREVAAQEPFVSALNGFNRQSPILPIEAYAALLFQEEAQEIIVFEKVYPHVLENADAVVDWISGTALVPYFERLNDSMRAEFVEAIRRRMRLELPSSPVFYPFKRILFSATKSK